MKKIVGLLIMIIGLISCSNSETEENNGILIGKFTEVTPINGRVILEFSSQRQLIQTFIDIEIISTYTIKLLNENQLELSCNECDEKKPAIVSYRKINNNTFEIGGFYPEKSSEIMTFERN